MVHTIPKVLQTYKVGSRDADASKNKHFKDFSGGASGAPPPCQIGLNDKKNDPLV